MTPISCKCRKPYVKGGLPYSCGQCLPCRISRRRLWVHRIMLEARLHGDSSFLTLTYDPKLDTFPKGGSLVPKDFTNFLKSLRRRFTTAPIRYYGVGEYGEVSGHPHYHAILFGYPTCSGVRCQDKSGRYRCPACEIVHTAWGKGHILLGDVTKDSASYVASYVTTGRTQSNEYTEQYLKGRTPEFARMSLRPGIGAYAIDKIAEAYQDRPTFGSAHYKSENDVPSVLESGGKTLPLGRYLKRRFRSAIGLADDDLKTPEVKLAQWKTEMSGVYTEAFKDAPFTPDDNQKKLLLTQLNKDSITVIENRFKKYNLKGAL